MRTARHWVLTAVGLVALLPASAQGDDLGLSASIGAEKKLCTSWDVEAEAEFRSRNDMKTASRWSLSAGTSYKLTTWLKASAGYKFLYDNEHEKVSYHEDLTPNNWRPSLWLPRHRFTLSLTASQMLGRISLSLREGWQYTYRPSQATERYDFDNNYWEYTEVRGKGRNVLRSRLQAKWKIRHCKVDPYASVELFNAWSVQKTRYNVGIDWKMTKQHTFNLFYRYQDVGNNDDDGDPDSHIIGLGYNFKF